MGLSSCVRRWVVAALCLAASAGVADVATAQAADAIAERAQAVINALRTGEVGAAAALLVDDNADALAARPGLVHVICDRAWRFEDAAREAPATDRRRLAERLVMLGESAVLASPDEPRAQWGLAHALVLRERAGPANGASAWLRAADLLVAAHRASPGGGEALGYAVTFLLEGAATDPESRFVLQKRADEVFAAAQRAHRDSCALACTLASAELWASRALLESDRKSARAALLQTFAALRPFARKDAADARVPEIWNEAVTFATEEGLGVTERYVTRTFEALEGLVLLDVPVSSHWVVTAVPETEATPAYVYVTQTGPAGEAIRQLLFRSYIWGRQYRFTGTVDVKGDEVKNIAKGLQTMSAERVFAPGAHLTGPEKERVGKGFTGHVFEVAGKTAGDGGVPAVLRGYCVRSGRQTSLAFLVYAWSGASAADTEMDAVLASLREPEE